LSGSPVQLQLMLKDYETETGSFDIGVESTGVAPV
jgi:hypothetical protein